MKRRQALLGSNLPRDSWMQVALNNAPEGSGFRAASLAKIHIQAFLLCLKKPI
ncbi:MAG TPA: hypothetical protein VKA69_02350 [Desulfobacteria bacterium]|nr:hypothetical protein [Desulfobacteria bacterium]